MLLSADNLLGFSVEAIDGGIGTVSDFYFDGEQWLVRYVVVATGGFFLGKKVLLWPHCFGHCRGVEKIMPVNMERAKVKESPDADTQLPVSRLYEMQLHSYYNWSPYWDNDFISTPIAMPLPEEQTEAARQLKEKIENTTLRSLKEVQGYQVKAAEGVVGRVADFILDEDDWSIRYAVVDTGGFLTGRKVLLSVQWLGELDWQSATFEAAFTSEQLKMSPAYDPKAPINREYEIQLFDYYGRPKYWR